MMLEMETILQVSQEEYNQMKRHQRKPEKNKNEISKGFS